MHTIYWFFKFENDLPFLASLSCPNSFREEWVPRAQKEVFEKVNKTTLKYISNL